MDIARIVPEALVEAAQVGRVVSELEALVHVETKGVLLDLIRRGLLERRAHVLDKEAEAI